MRFVCAGDLHLGSGADLSRDGADGRLAEQEAVLAQIIDAANEFSAAPLGRRRSGRTAGRRRPR